MPMPCIADTGYGSPKPPTIFYFSVLWTKLFGFSIASFRAITGFITVWTIIGPVTVFTFGTGFVFPNCHAGAIMPYPHMAGTAAALMGSIQMAGAALIGALVGQLHNGTAWPMVIVMAGCGIGIPTAHFLLVGRSGRADQGR